jgi:hypothetical protein
VLLGARCRLDRVVVLRRAVPDDIDRVRQGELRGFEATIG